MILSIIDIELQGSVHGSRVLLVDPSNMVFGVLMLIDGETFIRCVDLETRKYVIGPKSFIWNE